MSEIQSQTSGFFTIAMNPSYGEQPKAS